MKHAKKWCVLGWVALAVIGNVLWFVPGRGIRSEPVRSIQLMQRISIDLELLGDMDRAKLAVVIGGETNSEKLNRLLSKCLKESGDLYITNAAKSVSKDGLLRDAWGTPLAFALTNDLASTRLNPEIRTRRLPLLYFWSAGANKSNEFGFGDDLFVHR